MLLSSSSNSSQSSLSDSPVSEHHLHKNAWLNSISRRREYFKSPRYYSTPLKEDSPDSTPLQMYGLEPREPSIAEKPRRFKRFSHALDDIKEDLSLQIDSRNTSEKLRSRRRQSTTILDTSLVSSGSGSSAASSFGPDSPMSSEPPWPQSRPLSIFAPDTWSPPVRRLSRRLSILSFSQRKKRYYSGNPRSISQPDLIGTSTQI